MNIQEFARAYCSDIISGAKKVKDLFDNGDFAYDEIITEADGAKVKVVNTTSYQIPINDIFGMTREEFARVWPHAECLEMRDNYLSNYVILEGPELLECMRSLIRRELELEKLYESIPEAYR